MKWLVMILLVINFGLLGFFLASNYMLEHQDPVVTPPPPPYNGPIKLLSEQELAALPKKTPEPAAAPVKVAENCFEWGSFNPADSARALAALKKLELEKPGLQITAKPVTRLESTRYWVYIPPQKSLAEAQAKEEEIKGLGVEETLILQDAQWKNAISLGIFKDETLANKFIDKLHGMGVKNAVKLKRGQGKNETSYIIRHVQPEQQLRLTALKPHFSAGELKQVDCN